MHVERFAPSPTGLLHLGHAYSAWLGWRRAKDAGGKFLLRMEDLDASRVRPDYVEAISRDLAWLGLDWEEPVLFQSQRSAAYREALERLSRMDLVYPCTCTRRDIAEAASAPHGIDGQVYPGTCRDKAMAASGDAALRLNMARAIETLGGVAAIEALTFDETGLGQDGETGHHSLSAYLLLSRAGDIVLSRRDGAIAYHLAVVVDDAHQGISHVTRGQDLFEMTMIHRLLQALLDLPTPIYHHHRLVTDAAGKRLAKRDDARAIATYRDAGLTPADVLALTKQ